MYSQVVFAAYFNVFILIVSVREEIESLNNRAIGRIFAGDHSVVGVLVLQGSKGIRERRMGDQIDLRLTERLACSLQTRISSREFFVLFLTLDKIPIYVGSVTSYLMRK